MSNNEDVSFTVQKTTGIIIGLLLPMMVHVLLQVRFLNDGWVPFDTVYTYIPLAKQLMKNCLEFFGNPESFSVAPGTYIYMALNDADIQLIKKTNLVLSMLVLIFIFDTVYRLSGPVGAIGAVWLLVFSPLLRRYWITPQSEPPFIFFTMCWLWSLTYVCHRDKVGFFPVLSVQMSWGGVIFSGLMLFCATLTRATYMYWIPAALLVSVGVYFFSTSLSKNQAKKILAIHLVAMTCIGTYVAHNMLVFQKPSIATGAGIALYLGNNPVLGGYEPPFHGLIYDDAIATNNKKHISLEGDEILVDASKWMLKITPIPILVKMYWNKLGAILFFSRAHLNRQFFNDRAWRIFLLSLVILGVIEKRKLLVVKMLLGIMVYQCFVHLPVLYNPRYSIGALDIIASVLGGLGVVRLIRILKKPIYFFAILIGFILCVFIGALHQRESRPVMPNLSLGLHHLMQKIDIGSTKINGISTNPFLNEATVISGASSMEWADVSLEPAGLAILNIKTKSMDPSCHHMVLSFQAVGDIYKEVEIDIQGLAKGDDISYGTKDLVNKNMIGKLKVSFDCALNSKIQFKEISIYHASVGFHYRDPDFNVENIIK